MVTDVTNKVEQVPYGLKSRFFLDNRKPVLTEGGMFMCDYAINSIAIALNIEWQEAFDTFMEEVHRLCLEPADRRCINALLEAYHFYPQAKCKVKRNIFDLCLEMESYHSEQAVAIVMSRHMGPTGNMSVLMPAETGAYDCYYFDNMDPDYRWTDDVWIHWPDGENHSRKPRRKGNRKPRRSHREIPKDNKYYHYANKNPEGNRTGDCVIRAIASAMEITWHDALDRLISTGSNYYTVVNQSMIYEILLTNSGFRPCPQITKNGKPVKGKEFCEIMNKNRMKEDRVLAFVGKRHLSAVVPIEENGRTVFKFEDVWDCTDCDIGKYWIRGKKQKKKKR